MTAMSLAGADDGCVGDLIRAEGRLDTWEEQNRIGFRV